MTEFEGELEIDYVMGGLARDYTAGFEDPEADIGGERGVHLGLLVHWLDVAERSGMPFDPRLWSEAPIGSTFPACMAVKAAAEQADDAGYGYLRALREGLMCFRRKLDTTEALVEEARRVGLDAERFRIDLGSHATVEAFGTDLEEARAVPEEARRVPDAVVEAPGGERVTFPTFSFRGASGPHHWVFGNSPYDAYREAAVAAGATPSDDHPDVAAALHRFGRMALPEVEAVCRLPTPRAAAELWRLVSEWQAKPVNALTGWLFEPA